MGASMGNIRSLSAIIKLLCLVFACLACGCQTTALRVSTTAQSQSVTEFYYQQVLQNLAYLHDHPDGLPFFSVAGQGQTAIGDTVSFADQLGWDLFTGAGLVGRFLFDKQYGTFTGSRLSTQQWLTQTTIAPDRLALMRCAYLSVLGCGDPECPRTLCAFYGPIDPVWGALRPSWCFVCKRSCVPKWACHVGYCGDTAAWVPAGQMGRLSEFTKAILDVASVAAGNGSHIDAQITVLRAKAKDLGELLKNRQFESAGNSDTNDRSGADKKIESNPDPNRGIRNDAFKTHDADVVTMNSVGLTELQKAYVETVLQLEVAMLDKQWAETRSDTIKQALWRRRQRLISSCPELPESANCKLYVEPSAAPVLSPRLPLNSGPVFLNPPGS